MEIRGISFGSCYTSQCDRFSYEHSTMTNSLSENKDRLKCEELSHTTSSEEYTKKIQKKVAYINIQIGYGLNTKKDSKVNVVTVHPKIVEKMQNNTSDEKKYLQKLKDIEAAYKWVDSYHKMKGNTVECRHGYVNENGEFLNFAVIRCNDNLNEKLRNEARENEKKHIEKVRDGEKKKKEELDEKNQEKANDNYGEYEEVSNKYNHNEAEILIQKKMDLSPNREIILSDDEMQIIIGAAREDIENSELLLLNQPKVDIKI